ncbi:MAG: transcriptional repressor [Candidatus Kariarchaeum pelagius]
MVAKNIKQKNIDILKDAGLKVTHSRCKILEIFQSSPDEHYTADKLKDCLDDEGERIGLATIYRVLTQLEMADLIQKNNFNDNQSAYEIKKSHHDHLICTNCGDIIEFTNNDLEKLQEMISNNYNFTLESHVMTLFGKCNRPNCKGKSKK